MCVLAHAAIVSSWCLLALVDRSRDLRYKRRVSHTPQLLERSAGWLIAFFVAFLPEELKRSDTLRQYAVPSAHVVSGMFEALACAVLFVVGLIRYVASFGQNEGWTYLTNRPVLSHGDFVAVGLLGYVSYLVNPLSLLLLYSVGEGIVRSLDVTFTERRLGVAPAWLGLRIYQLVTRQSRRARLAVLLGPARSDEIVAPAESPLSMLEIYSVEDKPWRETQVIDFDGDFFQLIGRKLVQRGQHHAFQYLLSPLEAREIIRGAVLHYERPVTPEPDGRPSTRKPGVTPGSSKHAG